MVLLVVVVVVVVVVGGCGWWEEGMVVGRSEGSRARPVAIFRNARWAGVKGVEKSWVERGRGEKS